MRKYFVLVTILLTSILIVLYYAFRWKEISTKTAEYSNIKELSTKLEILNQKQKLLLDSLIKTTNYDNITKFTKGLNDDINILYEVLLASKDGVLIELAYGLDKKNRKLNYIYEDIKTDNAEIKNTIRWLTKTYKKYLEMIGTEEAPDKELMKYVFNILNLNDVNSLTEIKPYIFTINSKENILERHLHLVHKDQKKLTLLTEELNENDVTAELEKINAHVQRVINELDEELSSIIKALLISVLFLILFVLFVYIREIITNMKIASLKNELQQFADALNESAIVSKTDLEGNITYVNDRFCKVSGYSSRELVGQSHNIIRHPDVPSHVFKDLWDTIENKKIFKAILKNSSKSGKEYSVDSVIIPMMDIDNNIVEYLAVRYDVTELVRSRDAAIIAEKTKDEFLSNMSHELRTPLNVISGFTTILKKEIEDKKHKKYLQNISESSDHLIGLIGDILDLSKLQSGKFTLDYQYFNMKEKIKLFLVRFDAQLEMAKLSMNPNLDSSINVAFNGDWLRISQIMTNLISNALKFTPEGGEIEFCASYEDGEFKLIVSDNGIGMSKEAQEKIFKPFEQADSSTTRKYGGTGLGLSIVLNLVEQMRGTITLESKENEGSRFEVIIPLVKVHGYNLVKVEKAEEESREKLKGHILIAEDNKTNQMLIGILIDELGLTYDIANDGLEAVEMFSKKSYDLVLMDENMPNLSGTLAMKQIREVYGKRTPIIALTANVMSGDREKFLESGMNGYVAKPIDDEELYRVLKSFLT